MPVASDLETQIEGYLTEALAGYNPRNSGEKVVRDVIGGFVKLLPHEIAIVDSPIFQRLRNIFQTSLTLYTYPTANHSRFEHSLGCLSMADKIINTINTRQPNLLNIQEQYVIRLAALLHDIGHTPFSHASESYFEDYKDLKKVRESNRDFFEEAAPHEILGYHILNSNAFKELWKKIVSVCEPPLHREKKLKHLNIEHIAPLILGKPFEDHKRFIAQIINGPFDVDKMDYLQRDGYFSGIQTALDVERLFLTIGVHTDEATGDQFLFTDMSGTTVLEQMLFNKMILYSSVYHHHKVRSALIELHFLYDLISKGDSRKYKIKNLTFKKAVDFLKIDDYDILNMLHSSKEIKKLVKRIKDRNLLRRALVLCPQSLVDKRSPYFSSLQYDKRKRESLRLEICGSDLDPSDVYVDCPKPATFQKGTLESFVRISENNFIKLDDLYPVSGWVKGYAEYRYRGYVFARAGKEEMVAAKASSILKDKGVELNDNAFLLAKLDPQISLR